MINVSTFLIGNYSNIKNIFDLSLEIFSYLFIHLSIHSSIHLSIHSFIHQYIEFRTQTVTQKRFRLVNDIIVNLNSTFFHLSYHSRQIITHLYIYILKPFIFLPQSIIISQSSLTDKNIYFLTFFSALKEPSSQ